jgi:hypothetical protein
MPANAGAKSAPLIAATRTAARGRAPGLPATPNIAAFIAAIPTKIFLIMSFALLAAA